MCPARSHWEIGPSQKECSPLPLCSPPHRCALPPTPLQRLPTSQMPSPCSPVSRPLRASTVAAAAAQWLPRPRHPRRTCPTVPPAALQRPAGQWWLHPQGDHNTISHSSRPCGLRHPLPRRQTGHPWPPNKLPQNQGPTLPWRLRDKGGPSPLPEARTPWGGGEDISTGPFTLCLHPHSLEPWRGETGPPVPAHRLPASMQKCRHAAPSLHGFGSDLLGAGGQLQRPNSLSQRTHPTSGGCGDLPGSYRGAPWGRQA